jgi:hypothetical protein
MKSNLDNFYVQMQSGLGPVATNLGAILIAVSFLEFLSVCLLLILINKLRNDGKGEEKH